MRPAWSSINDYMARHRWPGQDPIGRRIALAGGDPNRKAGLTVVGVVKNVVRGDWSAEPDDEIYVSFLQARMLLENTDPAFAYITFVARTDEDPAALVPALRSAVWAIDPTLPISAVRTMEQRGRERQRRRTVSDAAPRPCSRPPRRCSPRSASTAS